MLKARIGEPVTRGAMAGLTLKEHAHVCLANVDHGGINVEHALHRQMMTKKARTPYVYTRHYIIVLIFV